MDFSQGQLVRSLAGRDQGKHYLVIGFAGERALVADGQQRTVHNPKKKNTRHLQGYKRVSSRVINKLEQGRLTDTDLRQELQGLLAREGARGKEVC